MEIMAELSLTDTCYPFQASQTECLAEFIEKTGRIIKEIIFDFFKRLALFQIIVPHIGISQMEIRDGLFNGLPLPQATITERSIIHIRRKAIVRLFDKNLNLFHPFIPAQIFAATPQAHYTSLCKPITNVGIFLLFYKSSLNTKIIFPTPEKKLGSKINRFPTFSAGNNHLWLLGHHQGRFFVPPPIRVQSTHSPGSQ